MESRTGKETEDQATVLVVDDNKEIVYSISELLKYEGFEVVKAYDGMQALNVLEEHPVDLILLDVMMPRLNGLSALMKLREKSRIPVIILSAKTEESDKVSGLVLGADDYVEKPYNPAELIARVKAHLRRYRAWGGGAPKAQADQIVNGGLMLDRKQRIVVVRSTRSWSFLWSIPGRCFLQSRSMRMSGRSQQATVWRIRSWCISGTSGRRSRSTQKNRDM